jgi:hypothetical protein
VCISIATILLGFLSGSKHDDSMTQRVLAWYSFDENQSYEATTDFMFVLYPRHAVAGTE